MANRIDFDAIKRAALAAYPGLLDGWLLDGRIDGNEYKARNPTRRDNTIGSFSVNLNNGVWADFSTGDAGGDAIDLYAYLKGLDLGPAARELEKILGMNGDRDHQPRPSPEHREPDGPAIAEWRQLLPIPDTAPRQLPTHPKYGKPNRLWTYKDKGGGVLGFICRFDTGPNAKEILPLTFCECTKAGFNGIDRAAKTGRGREWKAGETAWRWLSLPHPRPLYGLDRLAAKPDSAVIMVEGEKAADAASSMFPNHVVITWPGGSKAIGKVEWSALEGRRVIFWPDNDQPGIDCATGHYKTDPRYPDREELRPGLMQSLKGICSLLVISPPADKPKGWDAADAKAEGWTPETAAEWMKERISHAAARGHMPPRRDEKTPPPQTEDNPPPAEPDAGWSPPDDSPVMHEDYGDGQPSYSPDEFQILGYNRGIYYYLPTRSSQVVELTAGGHTKLNLLQIAPLHYWETSYPKKGGADWDMAANALINMCHDAGVFRPHERRRGRGAWLDEGRSVLHLGDMLLVNGERTDPIKFDSKYTYEGDGPLGIRPGRAASNAEANRLIDICRAIRWESGLSATALAGWCVIAPVCGVLNWRPHIWVTGPAGSGKSTVLRDVIGRVVGPIAIQIEGKTTEAAIRHSLGYDALPVIFDEAESEDQKSVERIQSILDLARAASSESGGSILKATNSGGVKVYRVRSCFCFSSINTAVKHYADETRITTLVLAKIKDTDEEQREISGAHYDELMSNIHNYLTPEYAAAMVARSVANLETLRINADTFTKAAALVLGNRRIGDQVGPMLAGAYLCHSINRIGFDDAVKWIRSRDWSEHTAAPDGGDENKLIQRIVENRVRLASANGPTIERTIGELIGCVLEDRDSKVTPEIANDELRRHGIRVDVTTITDPGGIYISTTSNALRQFLAGTPWASNWRRPLLSIDGADKCKSNIRFTTGLSTPAVRLPSALFTG